MESQHGVRKLQCGVDALLQSKFGVCRDAASNTLRAAVRASYPLRVQLARTQFLIARAACGRYVHVCTNGFLL